MAKRTVIWTLTASKQRREIFKYWIAKNGTKTYIKKLIVIIKERLEHVAKSPELFKQSKFPDTRVCAMGHFSVFYKISNQQIIVTAFWDNRQNPDELYKLISK